MGGWLDDVCLAVLQGDARSLISGAYSRTDLSGGFAAGSCRLNYMNRRPLSENGNGVVNVVLWVLLTVSAHLTPANAYCSNHPKHSLTN